MSSSTYGDTVTYSVSEGVATITLNRPERLNAWTPEMGALYARHISNAAADDGVRAIVVTGAGRGFCSGADVDVLQSIAHGSPRADVLTTELLEVPKPIIAAINGPCVGLGLVIALCCDVRFAAAGAKFSAAFVRRGVIAEYGSSWLLARLIGQAGAFDVLVSGRVFEAEEAERMGLINAVFPADQVLEQSLSYARNMATHCAPRAMALVKEQIYGDLNRTLGEAKMEALRLMDQSLSSDDFAEGVASFLEQRLPRFQPLKPMA